MLINLRDIMRTKLSELRNLQVRYTSCEFETPPRVLFVNDMETKRVISDYRDLKPVQLSAEEKTCVKNCLEANKNNPDFYNGYLILLKDVVYDSASNVLYVEALRCRYAVIFFLCEGKLQHMPELSKQGLFKSGALVPFVTQDGFTALLERKNKVYAPVAGFAEPIEKNANRLTPHTLPGLYECTAVTEALEEALWDDVLPRHSRVAFSTKGVTGITMLRTPNGESLVDFIVPIELKCNGDRLANILQTNCAPDAAEHTKNFEMVPLNSVHKSDILQKNLFGRFIYGPVLASAARVANLGSEIPRCLPGDKTPMIFSVKALVPQIERPLQSAKADLVALLCHKRVQKLITPQ